MAYGDFASLLPSEAYYTGPRGRVDAAKVEASKKASYLSSMDQFYAQLEEMERQFDVTAQFKEREMDFAEERFEWEKEYGTGELELKGKDIAMRERVGMAGPRAHSEAAEWQYDLGMEELDWKREEAEMTKGFLEKYLEGERRQPVSLVSGSRFGETTSEPKPSSSTFDSSRYQSGFPEGFVTPAGSYDDEPGSSDYDRYGGSYGGSYSSPTESKKEKGLSQKEIEKIIFDFYGEGR